MRTYAITRHAGAAEWLAARGHTDATLVAHAGEEFFASLAPGDVVVGTLPVHLAARVCASGAEYQHLVLDVPPALRGQELTAADMTACGATLQSFRVEAARPSRTP